jgi:hypothetical protein
LTDRDEILSLLMEMIDEASSSVRAQEDIGKKLLVDIDGDRAYIAIVAYRAALVDAVENIRNNNDFRKKRSNLPKGGSR